MKITLPELKNELGMINSKLDIVKDYLNLKTQPKKAIKSVAQVNIIQVLGKKLSTSNSLPNEDIFSK